MRYKKVQQSKCDEHVVRVWLMMFYLTGKLDFCDMSPTWKLLVKKHASISCSGGHRRGMHMMMTLRASVEKKGRLAVTNGGILSGKDGTNLKMAQCYQYLHDTDKR